ncbi:MULTISPECIES: SIMPL domain-containing protein [unclassified Halomonas]|uniref:SIMPL domain-containing protein n=1 Tax=unclassified Halomonas TaxID=2609666 RepID=UPI0021E48BAA|nr:MULTISPECIES: SIMPL domain-containing protein [unclassified Halomonas]UYF98656.1 SIMPL domain-containing protein [Halomonas sp. GD1P12]WNL40231.1 SIMPL domain-containing protein [Halomonas sp. PAMB 3232]
MAVKTRGIGALASAVALGGLVALGLGWGGSYLKSAAEVWQHSSRSVTVRGLAEREVAADLVLWPLNYTVTADTLAELERHLSDDEARVRDFLAERGFEASEISMTPARITDQYANTYGGERPDERFRAEATLLLRTERVEEVIEAVPQATRLVRDGVLLSPSYEYRTEFLFTGLDAIKPEMIAAATADARSAAQQFAEDSQSAVGGITSATQGYFSIEDLDSYTPQIKRVRVVTTVDYALE